MATVTWDVRAPDGRTIPIDLPEGSTEADAISAAQRQSPTPAAPVASAPAPTAPAPTPAAPITAAASIAAPPAAAPSRRLDLAQYAPAGLDQAVLDTLGLGRSGARTWSEVPRILLNPETPMEHVASGLTIGGLTGATGGAFGAVAKGLQAPAMVAKAAPLAGRLTTIAGVGAEKRKAAGEDPIGGLLDSAAAWFIEGATRGAGKALMNARIPWTKVQVPLGRWAESAEKFATEMPAKAREALDQIRARLPRAARFEVPSLSSTPITVDQAIAGLSQLTGRAYARTRQEILAQMQRFDLAARGTGTVPSQTVFGAATPETASGVLARGARQLERGRRSTPLAAAADVVGATDVNQAPDTTFPLGAVAGAGALGSVYGMARRLMP